MHLIELFLPLYDNEKRPIAKGRFEEVREELTKRFGGVTAFTRAPAVGVWKDESDEESRDEIVIFEVMDETMDRAWWGQYRERLEQRFRQREVLIRATAAERL